MSVALQVGEVVTWWRRLSENRVSPIRATVLAVTPKRIKIEATEPEARSSPMVRYVMVENLQRIAAYFLKSPEQEPCLLEPMRSWGRFIRYLETAEDLYAARQVDLFENGYTLRYDRSHWVDDCGMLSSARYCKMQWERWWGPAIDIAPAEFEEVWRAAELSAVRQMQLTSEGMSRRGVVPPWLRRPHGSV
jgi:hypothetical protein